jgi:hypothetical protein
MMAAASTISLAALAAAAAMSATAAIAQGEAAASEAKAQAALRDQQAQRQREVAAFQEERARRDAERVQGAQRARLAATGVDPAAGTALLLQEELAGQSEFNALLARAQGEGDARLTEHQARIDRLRGRNARTAGYLRAGTTLLTSASRAMGSGVFAESGSELPYNEPGQGLSRAPF